MLVLDLVLARVSKGQDEELRKQLDRSPAESHTVSIIRPGRVRLRFAIGAMRDPEALAEIGASLVPVGFQPSVRR